MQTANETQALDQLVMDFGRALEAGGELGTGPLHTPAEAAGLYAHGYGLYSQGRYLDALKTFWLLLRGDPFEARYCKGAGACLQMLKRPRQAILAYGMAWAFKPDDPVPLFHLAECFIAEKMLDEARETLDTFATRTRGRPEHAALHERALGLAAGLAPKHQGKETS